jgi:hypothetical protein
LLRGIASTSAVVVPFFAEWRSRFERPESLSGFARMKYPQHDETRAIESILKHVGCAEHLQYDLTILFPTRDRPPEPRMLR